MSEEIKVTSLQQSVPQQPVSIKGVDVHAAKESKKSKTVITYGSHEDKPMDDIPQGVTMNELLLAKSELLRNLQAVVERFKMVYPMDMVDQKVLTDALAALKKYGNIDVIILTNHG